MKNIKKLFAVVAAALALTLAACNNTNNSSNDNPSSADPSSSIVEPVAPVKVTGIELELDAYEGPVGDEYDLVATVSPANADDKSIIWTSTDVTTVSVSKTGHIKLLREGEAVITATTVDGGFKATCDVSVKSYAQMIVISDDNVGISCVDDNAEFLTSSKKSDGVYDYYNYDLGAVAYFGLEFDPEVVDVQGVVVYNAYTGYACGICGTENANYYFPLPKDVDFFLALPIYELVSEKEVSYPIYLDNADEVGIEAVDGMKVTFGVNEEQTAFVNTYAAVAGATVTFKFNLFAGYNFAGEIKVVGEAGEVPVIRNADGSYSFIMPNGPVHLEVVTKAANLALNIVDDFQAFSKVTVDGEVWERNYAPYGSSVQIELNMGGDMIKPTSVYIPEADVELIPNEGSNIIGFTMPNFGISVYPQGYYRYVEYTIEETAHVSIIAMYEDEEGMLNPLEPDEYFLRYGETVYFVAIPDDGYVVDYVAVDSFTYYQYSYADTSVKTQSAAACTYVGTLSGYPVYSYQLSLRAAEDLVFFCSERYIAPLENSGMDYAYYVGVNMYGYNGYLYDDYRYIQDFSLYDAGYGSWEGDIASYNPNTCIGTYVNTSGYECEFFFDGTILASGWSRSSLVTTDMYFYVMDPELEYLDYWVFNGEVIQSGDYYALEIYLEDYLYATVFADRLANKIYTNVTFDFIAGETVTDDNALYQVLDEDGNVLYTVGCPGKKTGRANRAVSNNFLAYETSNGDVMYLDGLDHAFYNDDIWYITMNGNVATGKNADGSMVISFRVIPELQYVDHITVEEFKASNPLEGRTFAGTGRRYSNATTSSYYSATWTIEFTDATHCLVTFVYSNAVKVGGLKNASKIDACRYSIDGNTVTVQFYALDTSSSLTTWTFTLSADWKSLTCTSTNRVNASSYYWLPYGAATCATLNNYVAE